MSFHLSDAQRDLQARARELAQTVIAPRAVEVDSAVVVHGEVSELARDAGVPEGEERVGLHVRRQAVVGRVADGARADPAPVGVEDLERLGQRNADLTMATKAAKLAAKEAEVRVQSCRSTRGWADG